MIPYLKTDLSEELFNLENYIIHHSCDIEHWFRNQWQEHQAPFYGSVDLRNSGFKLAPVDTNLFPGGFNNLNPEFTPLSVQASSVAIENICPEAWRIIIIPEKHTRNIFYLKNLYELSEKKVKEMEEFLKIVVKNSIENRLCGIKNRLNKKSMPICSDSLPSKSFTLQPFAVLK